MNTYQMYLGLTRPDNEIITTEQFYVSFDTIHNKKSQ